jgi:putative MATE family efflux protein
MGFSIAMSSVISRLIGEGNFENVQRVTTHGLILVFLLGIIIAVTGYIILNPLFTMMGANPSMLSMIREYMLIWFAGTSFLAMPMVGNAAIRATGNTLLPALIMTVAALVNAILDPILIFGLLGFPRLELQGAALATVIANILAMMAGLYVITVRKKLLSSLNNLRLDLFLNSVKRLAIIAIPAGITNAIQPVVNAIIISLLARTGSEAVAAYGIVTRLEAFAFVILMGLAVGMAPIIGQNWGAGHFERINKTLRLAIGFSVFWSLFIAVFFGLFGSHLASLFSDNPQIISFATLFFWIVPITYAFSNLINGWASAFNAMGKPHRSFLMIVGKMIVLMIPAIYLGYYISGVTGLFVSIAATNIISGIIVHLWARRSLKNYKSPHS